MENQIGKNHSERKARFFFFSGYFCGHVQKNVTYFLHAYRYIWTIQPLAKGVIKRQNSLMNWNKHENEDNVIFN